MMKTCRKFKCTVKYRLTEYFMVTAEAQCIQNTVSSDPVNLI